MLRFSRNLLAVGYAPDMRGRGSEIDTILYGDFQRTPLSTQDGAIKLGDLGAWSKFVSFSDFGLPIAEIISATRELGYEQLRTLSTEADKLGDAEWRPIWEKIDRYNRERHSLASEAVYLTFNRLLEQLIDDAGASHLKSEISNAVRAAEDVAYAILAAPALTQEEKDFFTRPWSRLAKAV